MITYNMGVSLTTQEQESYSYWSEVWASCNARFSDDAALASSCIASKDNRLAYALSMSWYEDLGKKDRWSPQVLGKAANMWLRAGNRCQYIVERAAYKEIVSSSILIEHTVPALLYSNNALLAEFMARYMRAFALPYHGNIPSQQREVTTVKHYKTKPDVSTTKTKTVGAATFRREAVEAFLLPTSAVRVLCLSRLPDYDSRLRNAPLLVNCSGNVALTELLQPQVCVYLFCKNTYEHNKLLRKQRGQAVTEITSIAQITC